MDIDLIKTTQAHLRALKQANIPTIDEYTLRIASAPLRFLLVDGNLLRSWRSLGKSEPIQIEAYCFNGTPPIDAISYCGGGELMPGIPISIGWAAQGEIALCKKTLNLPSFLDETCIYARGIQITRRELVKYIANTKGGTHYDPQGLSPKSNGVKFIRIRELEKGCFAGLDMKVNDKNLVHYELYSIIQNLLRSSQVQTLQIASV